MYKPPDLMIINYFEKWTYEIPEVIATLYAVWNNRIIKQEPITDDLLKEDFLNWDEQKIKYKDRLDNALNWMRENGIVPDGWGKVIEKANKKFGKQEKVMVRIVNNKSPRYTNLRSHFVTLDLPFFN